MLACSWFECYRPFAAAADMATTLLELLIENCACRPASGDRVPRKPCYNFSTWPNSSSTGVALPKMVTDTLSRLFS